MTIETFRNIAELLCVELEHFEADDDLTEMYQYDHYELFGEWPTNGTIAVIQLFAPTIRVDGIYRCDLVVEIEGGDSFRMAIGSADFSARETSAWILGLGRLG